MWVAVVIVIVVIVAVALWAVGAYNGLVRLRNKIESAYAQIDVQLKRRHDLIPNLVETVKGYAAHERSTLEAVVDARNAAMSAASPVQAAASESALSGALKSLFALAEAYPDLKANANFAQLQAELTATEDRIAYSRQYYNDIVQTYNTRIETMPTALIASRMQFHRREYFEVAPEERGGVQVDFS